MKNISLKYRFCACFLLIVLAATATFGIEARRIIVPITQTGVPDIDIDKDHYSVELVDGWISSRDSILRALISSNSSMVTTAKRNISFFDGEALDLSSVYNTPDVNSKIGRPLVLGKTVINNVPADATIGLQFKIAVNREERLTQVFNALHENEALLPVDFLAASWVGYSAVAINLVNKIFGADKTKYPFYWEGEIKNADPTRPNIIKPHYIVLIAPNKDSDTSVRNMDASKLTYSDTQQQLIYNGSQVTDHTYMVLRVSKSNGYDIQQYVLSSKAPWAVLARNQFFNTQNTIRNKEQLVTGAENYRTQLGLLLDLLLNENRFSKFERATALAAFSKVALDRVNDKCKTFNLKGNDCPNAELRDFGSNIARAFRLQPTSPLGTQILNAGSNLVLKLPIQ